MSMKPCQVCGSVAWLPVTSNTIDALEFYKQWRSSVKPPAAEMLNRCNSCGAFAHDSFAHDSFVNNLISESYEMRSNKLCAPASNMDQLYTAVMKALVESQANRRSRLERLVSDILRSPHLFLGTNLALGSGLAEVIVSLAVDFDTQLSKRDPT